MELGMDEDGERAGQLVLTLGISEQVGERWTKRGKSPSPAPLPASFLPSFLPSLPSHGQCSLLTGQLVTARSNQFGNGTESSSRLPATADYSSITMKDTLRD